MNIPLDAINTLPELSTVLKYVAAWIDSFAQAGLCREPFDFSLEEALKILRANCPAGELNLVLRWSDQESDVSPCWEFTTQTELHSANTLCALLRLFAAKSGKPDSVRELDRKYYQDRGEKEHGE